MLLSAGIFIVLGVLIKHARMHFLIAGYNTMSSEKKKNYDIDGIASLFRNIMFGMALLIILGFFLSEWLELAYIEDIAFFGALFIGIP